MFGLGLSEIFFLAVLALILIGPDKLPEMARNLARFINDLKRATDGFTDDLKQQVKTDFKLDDGPKIQPPQLNPEVNNLVQHHQQINSLDANIEPSIVVESASEKVEKKNS